MNAENEFERWWDDTSYGETVPLTDGQLRDICYAAFALGRKSENEAIRGYIVEQGKIDYDIDAIRQRIEDGE